MAFMVYFFVLLVAASSVLFALDWVNAPLQLPAPAERTQVANSTTQNKPEPFAQQQPPAVTPSAPSRPTQAATSATQSKPEPVAQQEPPAATPSAPSRPTQAATSATQTKPEPVAQQQPPAATPSVPPRPTNSATQTKPEPVAPQEPPAATPSAPAEPTQAANSSTAQQQLSDSERTRAAAPEKLKSHAKRKLSRRTSPQSAASARAQSLPRAERRDTERAPSWAIRGAEAARREAEQNPQRAPVQPFRPFWENEGGWHFR